tara:strand:+ start:397 stop:591 length:195 start_codon:yes stop_codon:yes gene_type:complete
MIPTDTLRDLINAAEEGLRNTEDDVKHGVLDAQEAVDSHTAAIAAAEKFLEEREERHSALLTQH